MQIQDNSPELDLNDPGLQAILSGEQSEKKVEAKVEKKADVKPAPTSSVEATTKEEEEDETDEVDPVALKAQVKGLQAELARRRGNADRVDALEHEITALKTKATQPTNEYMWVQKLDDEGLASKSVDWDDELADARAKYGRAEDAGDEKAMERQGQRILTAKKTQAAFRRELMDRTKREHEQAQSLHDETQSIQAEITDMHEAVADLLPDLMMKDSEVWKAGNEEYINHPALMKQLGPLGEVVAAAMAVVRNPALVENKTTPAARRDVLSSLEKTIKKSLSTGAASPTRTRMSDVASSVDSGDGLSKFNALIDRIKGG
jgi:hypothetical protein